MLCLTYSWHHAHAAKIEDMIRKKTAEFKADIKEQVLEYMGA